MEHEVRSPEPEVRSRPLDCRSERSERSREADSDVGSPEPEADGGPAAADAVEPPASGGTRLKARLVALGEVALCSGFPTQIFIAQVLAFGGLVPFTANRQYSAAFVFILSIVDAVVLVGLALWFLRRHGESPKRVLFGRRPLSVEAALGIVLIPIVFGLAVIVLVSLHELVPSLHNVTRNPLAALMQSKRDALLFAFVVIVSGGVREEVQRAFILHRFEQHLGGGIVGLIAFSFVFGAGHVVQGWDAAVATATLGAFWGALYLVRRSIAAPLVSHAGFDLAEIIRYTLYGL